MTWDRQSEPERNAERRTPVLRYVRGRWGPRKAPSDRQKVAAGALEDKADVVFSANIIPAAETDARHDAHWHCGWPVLRNIEGIYPGAHDVGHPSVLPNVVGEYHVVNLGHG